MSQYKVICMIDDDVEDQELFIDAVREIDSSIQCFGENNGELALLTLGKDAATRPDLIFLDLNMPRLNGKQLLAELKQTEGVMDIPVIMCSTFFGERDIVEIKKLGAAHYMLKPTGFNELLNAIRQILTKKW